MYYLTSSARELLIALISASEIKNFSLSVAVFLRRDFPTFW